MTAYTSQTVASRLGYSLGRVVRFFMHDSNPLLRWSKRLALSTVLLVLSINLLSWLAGAVMGFLTIGFILFAMAKADLAVYPGARSTYGSSGSSEHSITPNPGEYDHPDYSLYYED